MDLLHKHDPEGLRQALHRLLLRQGLAGFVQDTITPLNRAVGEAADGVQPIVELPVEPYFTWHSNPILAQFRSVYEIGKEVEDYKYLKPPSNATPDDKYRAHPVFNVFDFWWLYIYFLQDNRSGFSVALLVLLMAIYYASRLWLILHKIE